MQYDDLPQVAMRTTMRRQNTKPSGTKLDRKSAGVTLMTREEYDWSEPYCPHCGSGKIFMLVVRLHPVRALPPVELAKAMAAGVVVEGENYYLQKKLFCLDCDATTKFTEPAETPWAPRPN
jgi:hypothetical protein